MRYRITTTLPDNLSQAPFFDVSDDDVIDTGMTVQEFVADSVIDELADDFGRALPVGTVVEIERIG